MIRPINRTYKIYHNKAWNEWQVRVYDDNLFNEAASYYTDSKEDAEETMRRMMDEDYTKGYTVNIRMRSGR